MIDTKKPRYVSVLYEIVDESAWKATNPMRWEHHGAKSMGASVGNFMEREEALEAALTAMDTMESRAALEAHNQLFLRGND